ncbi:hypothetical protein WA026_008299 [Henosepilachna vigintioctopunctata]|uniref:Secreted protein n=1 Tax=Henosepilachna vigintioctopunctata TaxID=420089 RepID=A0AAW1TIV6_9CUCU
MSPGKKRLAGAALTRPLTMAAALFLLHFRDTPQPPPGQFQRGINELWRVAKPTENTERSSISTQKDQPHYERRVTPNILIRKSDRINKTYNINRKIGRYGASLAK